MFHQIFLFQQLDTFSKGSVSRSELPIMVQVDSSYSKLDVLQLTYSHGSVLLNVLPRVVKEVRKWAAAKVAVLAYLAADEILEDK